MSSNLRKAGEAWIEKFLKPNIVNNEIVTANEKKIKMVMFIEQTNTKVNEIEYIDVQNCFYDLRKGMKQTLDEGTIGENGEWDILNVGELYNILFVDLRKNSV